MMPLSIPRWVGIRLGAFLLVTAALGASMPNPKRVLILDPFEREVAPYSAVASAFRTTLAHELGEPVDFYELPLDLARFSEAEGEAPLAAFLEGRLKNRPVDLVVPIGSAGLQFAARHRERLFPNTPLLVLAAQTRVPPPGFPWGNATLVAQKVDIPGMIEDILQLQPQTTNIVVVLGASELERFWGNEFRREFQPFTNRVGFTWLNDLSLEQIVQRCAALPPRSFILHGLFVVDAAGIPCENNEALRRLHQVANAPIFGYFASECGLGIIGGRLYQDSENGVQGALSAVRILHGESPGSIPPKVLEPTAPVYDWRELKRWGISETGLPAGSIIQYREPGFWELYRWPIAGAVLFCSFEAALIIALLVSRAKRRQAEVEAALIAEISSGFVNLPSEKVDGEILNAERRICELLGLDLAGLWQWSAEADTFILTHLYRVEEGPQTPERMSTQEYFPWYQKQMLAGRTIVVHSMDELPPEAARDREVYGHFGIKSNVVFPLAVGGGAPVGALGFNSTKAERQWPEGLLKRLQLVAQIFTNALARKHADQSLRNSEERMTLAAEAAQLGVWGWNLASNEVWGSERWMHLFGFAPGDQVWFEKIIQIVHPNDRERVEKEVRSAVAERHDYAGEFRIVLPDSTERWISSRGRVYPDADDLPARMLGAAFDVTARKRAEAALQASEERFRALSESALVGIYILQDGAYTYVNPAMACVFGYSVDEMIGMNPCEIVHPDDHKMVEENIHRAIIGEVLTMRYEMRGRNKDGSTQAVEVFGTRVEMNGKVALVGTLLDITERKRAHESLVHLVQQNKLILNSTAEGILGLDLRGNHLFINPAAARMLGYQAEELLGRHSHSLWHHTRADGSPLPEEECKIYHTFADGKVHRESNEVFWRKDGTSFPVEYASTPIYEEGRLLGAVVTFEDITERKRAAMETQELRGHLAHVARVSTMGELAASVAHELNQPLGAILANAEAAELFLEQNPPAVEEVRAILADIRKDDERAGQVIRRMRTLLRKRELERRPLDINALVGDVLQLVSGDAALRGVSLVADLSPVSPQVAGDRVHLQQVLLNLMLNGMDALDGQPRDRRWVQVRTHFAADRQVQVEVIDRGHGIPPERFAKLFEPFYTTKPNGMGMGLPVSKTIIEAHKGRLWAENRPEGGACFCFTVPLADGDGEGATGI